MKPPGQRNIELYCDKKEELRFVYNLVVAECLETAKLYVKSSKQIPASMI